MVSYLGRRDHNLIFTERYRSGHNEAVLKTVWGSRPTWVRIPLPPPEKPTSFDLSVFQLNPPLRVGEILLCNVKYACGVWNSPRRRVGGFNFTWCDSIKFHNLRSKLFHRERKRTISLKTNGYVRVRIHMQKCQKYLFRSPHQKSTCESKCFSFFATGKRADT